MKKVGPSALRRAQVKPPPGQHTFVQNTSSFSTQLNNHKPSQHSRQNCEVYRHLPFDSLQVNSKILALFAVFLSLLWSDGYRALPPPSATFAQKDRRHRQLRCALLYSETPVRHSALIQLFPRSPEKSNSSRSRRVVAMAKPLPLLRAPTTIYIQVKL